MRGEYSTTSGNTHVRREVGPGNKVASYTHRFLFLVLSIPMPVFRAVQR